MPDYSACMSTSCLRRGTCARYLMKWGSDYQTVASPDPATCGLHWDVTKGTPFVTLDPEAADQIHRERIERWRKANEARQRP